MESLTPLLGRRTNGVLWAGLALLLVQWSLFLRLTFWELSWDVMEPISYFFSSLWGIVAYCYFLVRPLPIAMCCDISICRATSAGCLFRHVNFCHPHK